MFFQPNRIWYTANSLITKLAHKPYCSRRYCLEPLTLSIVTLYTRTDRYPACSPTKKTKKTAWPASSTPTVAGESETVKRETVESETVRRETVKRETVKNETVESETVKVKPLNVKPS